MLTKKNIPFIAKSYLQISLIEADRGLELIVKTKRTYHFRLNDNIKISISTKALREFEEKYR